MGVLGSAIQAGGAILGGITGGKSKNSGGQRPLPYLAKATENVANWGQAIAKRPYEAYTGQRVAPFSPDTQAAFDMIRQNVGAATPMYQSAMGTAQGLTGYQPQQVGNIQASQWAGKNLDPYMNPYISSVIDANAADQQNAYGQQYNQMASQAQAAGAFGGSRFGVAQGQLAADSVRNQALLSAQLRSQGFDNAAQLLGQDVDRQNWATGVNQQTALANQSADIQGAGLRSNAAGLLGNLAGNYQNSLGVDASQTAMAGEMQDRRAQQQLDVGYGDYIDRTRTYPAFQMGLAQDALAPALQQYAIRNQTPTQTTGGGAAGALGGAMMGAQLAGSLGGSLAGLFGNRMPVPSSISQPYNPQFPTPTYGGLPPSIYGWGG